MTLTNLLVHSLAIAVGLGSLTLYLAAFFFPEVHRRHDFFWSGVGLFYALVLWFGGGSMDATTFLGHGASVSLIGWLGWQTLALRRKRTPLALQTPYTSDSWSNLGQEIMALGQDFINQTALGRWLTQANRSTAPTVDQDQRPGLRASSLKQVDYEFLDDLAKVEPMPGQRSANPELQPVVVVPPSPAGRPGKTQVLGELGSRPGTTATQPNSLVITKQRQAPLGWRQRWPVLGEWIGDLWRSLTTPKPKRAVIEIPPREALAIIHPPPEPIPPEPITVAVDNLEEQSADEQSALEGEGLGDQPLRDPVGGTEPGSDPQHASGSP